MEHFVVAFDWYLFQLIVLLKPDFICCNIANAVAWPAAALDITQFADQVKMRIISQLINCILRVLQKLLKYFNGTIILTAFVPLFPIEPVISCLYFNEAQLPGKLSRAPASVKIGSSL